MARRVVHHKEAPLGSGVSWSLFEDRSADPAGAGSEETFLEDSIITVAIQWGSLAPGRLMVGPYERPPDYSARNLGLYVVPLQSYVGRIRLVVEGPDGTELGMQEMDVSRRKLAAHEDLAELEQHWTLARFPLAPRQKQGIFSQMRESAGAGDPRQWLQSLHRESSALEHQMRNIAERPRHGLSQRTQSRRVTSLRRPTAEQVGLLFQGRLWVRAEEAIWDRDPEAAAFASFHARFVHRMIGRIMNELSSGQSLGPGLKRALGEIQRDLDRIMMQAPRKFVRPRPRQALMHDRRYRDLERASRLVRRNRSLQPGKLESLRPPTYELYEQWCAWALLQMLAPESEWPRLRALLSEPPSEGVRLARGGREILMRFQHEMRIVAEKDSEHRPDFMIEIEDPRHVIILDAKYRQDPHDARRPPQYTINELHRYRDVYRVVHPESRHKQIWAAVLYPSVGLSDGDVERTPWYETACHSQYRIGAIPLVPSLMGPLRRYLSTFGLTL